MGGRREILFLACLLAGCVDRENPSAWRAKLSHVYTQSSDYQRMAIRLAELMDSRTGGRFRITIYPSGQLGGERTAFEQLQAGALEMGISGTPVLSGWVPETQIFDLPYLFRSREQGLSVLSGKLGDWWRELLLEKTGVRSLGFLDYGFRHVYNSRRAIRSPADLEGLKLRVLQSATYIATYEAFGVQATPMSYGEVYSALQQGVIDGGEANLIGYATDRLYEVGRHFSFTSITYNPITLLVNERFYRSLPPDVRDAFDRSVVEALAYQSTIARDIESQALSELKAAGVEFSYPTLEPFQSRARPQVWRELAARLPEGEALIERLESEIGRVDREAR
jgi:tripartite ATP-independent transporter DctP family solute receptor